MSNIPAQADETAENSADISREIKFAAAKKSTWVSVWVNTLLSAWQIVAGIFSHSQGLIADGIHTFFRLLYTTPNPRDGGTSRMPYFG